MVTSTYHIYHNYLEVIPQTICSGNRTKIYHMRKDCTTVKCSTENIDYLGCINVLFSALHDRFKERIVGLLKLGHRFLLK